MALTQNVSVYRGQDWTPQSLIIVLLTAVSTVCRYAAAPYGTHTVQIIMKGSRATHLSHIHTTLYRTI